MHEFPSLWLPRRPSRSRSTAAATVASFASRDRPLVSTATALGHAVWIANSRGPASLAALATETGATAATVEQAARARDLVIIAIPQNAVPQLPRGLLSNASAIIVDTGIITRRETDALRRSPA
jgi:predicted dinucleotide-binding enzyme